MGKKHQYFKVNLSSSFMAKNRCRSCSQYPSIYYAIPSVKLWRDVNDENKFKDIMMSIFGDEVIFNSSFYKIDKPSDHGSMMDFNYPYYDSYNPKLHKNNGLGKQLITEFLTCKCGKSIWAFNESDVKNRLEIFHRKSKNHYPKSFKY